MTALQHHALRELVDIAQRAADEAAALLRSGFRTRPRIEEKAPRDLVTEFDRASERLIVDRLGALAKGIPVVGEEQTGAAGTTPRGGLVWCVDPLDGTTNFVHGHPFWCVSIGLLEDDVPIAGVVVAPALGLRWAGGCSRTPELDPAVPAQRNGERCAVSTTKELPCAMVATGFPAARDLAPDNNFDAFISVKRIVRAVRRCGSAALDLCLVGDGTYDGYWERRLHVWDVAAGCAIVRSAGGMITSLDGGPPNYHVGRIVASNGLIHAELVKVIQASDAG